MLELLVAADAAAAPSHDDDKDGFSVLLLLSSRFLMWLNTKAPLVSRLITELNDRRKRQPSQPAVTAERSSNLRAGGCTRVVVDVVKSDKIELVSLCCAELCRVSVRD